MIVLNGHLRKDMYSHFLLLVYAIRILVSAETCQIYNEKAELLLKTFVLEYGHYGHNLITYNVHSLIHLPKYVKIHGSLDNFSSFRNENYLQELKKSVKPLKYPLQEVFNRIKENKS